MKVVLAIFVSFCFLFLFTDEASAEGYYQKNSQSAVKVKNTKQAAKLVKKRLGGKVLKVKKQKVNGHRGYKVKLLKKNGHVVSVLVDPVTGKVIGGK